MLLLFFKKTRYRRVYRAYYYCGKCIFVVAYICIKNIWKKKKKPLAVVISWGGWKIDRGGKRLFIVCLYIHFNV